MQCHIIILLIFLQYLVLWDYWAITESRIALKPVLGGIRIVPLQLILINEETHAVFRFTIVSSELVVILCLHDLHVSSWTRLNIQI